MKNTIKTAFLLFFGMFSQTTMAQTCSAFFWWSNNNLYKYSFLSSTNSSSTKYSWDFGDGNTSNSKNPVHQFPLHKDFKVCLTVKDTISACTDTYCYLVTYCETSFWTRGIGLKFEGYSSRASNPKWDFGDGVTSKSENAFHTYKTYGIYNICLTSYCSSKDSSTRCIQLDKRCNANFTYAFDSAYPLKVKFTMEAKSNASSKVFWNYGEDTKTYSDSSYHTFKKDGYYNVVVQVIDTLTGCRDSVGMNIRVGHPPCDTSFKIYKSGDCNQVYFTSNVYTENLRWDFGDGNSSNEKSGVHYYDGLQTYQLCMSHTCYSTDTVKKCTFIPVKTKAMFTYKVDAVQQGRVNFINTSAVTSKVRYQWEFGDGVIEQTKSPIHVYKKKGKYYVWLVVIDDSLSCISRCLDTVNIDTIIQIQKNIRSLAKTDFRVYPNPFSKTLYIEGKSTAIQVKDFEIMDAFGRVVLKQRIKLSEEPVSINTETLPKGLYILKLSNGQSSLNLKFLKE